MVSHVKSRSRGFGNLHNPYKPPYSNLIVLCGSHHNDAHGKNPQGKMIPKTKLKSIVKGRSKTRADNIKTVLKAVGKRGEGKRQENSRYPWEIDFRF